MESNPGAFRTSTPTALQLYRERILPAQIAAADGDFDKFDPEDEVEFASPDERVLLEMLGVYPDE